MSEGDGSAVGIDFSLLPVAEEMELSQAAESLGGEGPVDLNEKITKQNPAKAFPCPCLGAS